MTVKELVTRYGLEDANDGRLRVRFAELVKKEKMLDELKARKDEILAYCKAEREAAEKAKADRQNKINAIEGLDELKKAVAEWDEYHEQFNRCLENENTTRYPHKPQVDIDELRAKYPRASAYLMAENWSYASHHEKSSLGDKALEQIINGADYNEVINNMKTAWTDYCNKRLWD